MKLVYLDKKDRVHAWLASRQFLLIGTVALVFLFLPLWRESVLARFVLEPVSTATLRAAVPGVVDAIYPAEGTHVNAGDPIARLRNLPLRSELDLSEADYRVAAIGAASAQFRYTNVGTAIQQRDQLGEKNKNLALQADALLLRSPVSGVVLTPRLTDHLGDYLAEGSIVAEIADLSVLRARIYVSEYDVTRLQPNPDARIAVDGLARKWSARATGLSAISTQADPSLVESSKYKGLVPPNFYSEQLLLTNPDGALKPGMRGTARLYGRRRALMSFAWETVSHFFGRKLW